MDSLVVTSSIIGKKTFTDLPSFVSGTLDLGNLTIERYCPDCPTVLYEGKIYHTVKIGSQCWMKENLDVGNMILGNQGQSNNEIIEKYCYGNNPSNCETYGGLYQWNEAMQYNTTSGTQGICPPGWHLPTMAEFEILRAIANYNGNLLKAIGQGWGNGIGTNTSGFSALLAGFYYANGSFGYLYDNAYFWSSSQEYPDMAYGLALNGYVNGIAFTPYSPIVSGFSIRCIKD